MLNEDMSKSVKTQSNSDHGIIKPVPVLLPDSILLEIFSYLSFVDLSRSSRVCKQWYKVSQDSSLQKIVDTREKSLSVKQVWKLLRYKCPTSLKDLRLKGFVLLLKSGKIKWKTLTVTQTILLDLQKRCPDIKTLCLEAVFLDSGNKNNELAFTYFPKTLTCLSLRNCFFHPDKLFGATPNKQLPHLEHLDLSHCALVSSYDLYAIAMFTHLKQLYLEGCFRINNGGIDFIHSLLPHLQVLDVEGTDISDNGLSTILNRSTVLKELYVGHTKISAEAFECIAKSTSVEILCLMETHISDNIVTKFADIFPCIRKLIIQKTSISDESIQTLNSKLPNCRIDHGEKVANCKHSLHHWSYHQKY